ncbi:MAG: TetR/AcrR family transcriptional regulator [Fibrobacter sp.]|nr:TetR/AcrR family transcriptional regulator [Fibrobacter sp.]
MPKSFSPQQRDQILKMLLANGKELFSRFGLQKTTVEEIARKCGISKGAFYLFFNSKEELFFEIIEKEEVTMKNSLLKSFPTNPSPEDLTKVLSNAFSFASKNPVIMQAFNPHQFQLLIGKLPPEQIASHINKDNDFANALINALHIPDGSKEVEIVSGLLRSLFLVYLHKDEMGITDETFKRLTGIVADAIVNEKRQ